MTFTIGPVATPICTRCEKPVTHEVYDALHRVMFRGCYDHCSGFVVERDRSEAEWQNIMERMRAGRR